MTQNPDDLLTIPQAAARLGISVNTCRRMVQKGELPEAIKVSPRKWAISAPRLERRLHGDTFAQPVQRPQGPQVASDATGLASSPVEPAGTTASPSAPGGSQ